jgi:Ca2+-transporting ATPase
LIDRKQPGNTDVFSPCYMKKHNTSGHTSLHRSGLTDKEVLVRFERDGYNELPSEKPQTFFFVFLGVIRQPMLLLLLGCGGIYILLGELKDAGMLLAFVFVVIGITFYQERKTSRALEALKNLSSPRALVVRSGRQLRIPGREVVVDDIILLKEGDRVPADAMIISCSNMTVDESLLTGESVPVRKATWDGVAEPGRPGGEDLPFVFSGTLVTQGRGMVRVFSTGIKTEMGRIGKSLQTIVEEDTPLKKEISLIVRDFAAVGVALCVIVVALYGIARGEWLKGILSGLTLSMAMLPEEFPVVFLIFMTLGAWRMSKRHVLTRNNHAIETLGAATVLCVDKTGTLTMNHMRLAGMVADSKYSDVPSEEGAELPEACHRLFEYGILSSQQDPFDPLEKEIKETGERFLSKTEHIHERWQLVKEYPLSRELLALSHVCELPKTEQYVIAAKGAPEAIADLCHLPKIKRDEVERQIKAMSEKGLRILGVASAHYDKKNLPADQHDFIFEYIGLLGFVDPVRAGVRRSVAECYRAGVRVIMITGDYPGTAQYVAREIGLDNPETYITGPQLAAMGHMELREKIRGTNIFARVIPEQKLAIVNALKANGAVVAMTGDGVNDAPALKASHIGVAMGERGTDVARETSDLVLLNDDFSSIVSAIRLGRRIFDNLQKAIAYIFVVHVPIAGMALFPIVFGLPPVLFPAHIAFLELIIDPACSTVFESEREEHDVMDRSPRDPHKRLFDKQTLILSLLQGASIFAVVVIMFMMALYKGLGENEARTLAFVTMVFGNLLAIVTNLSKTDSFIATLKKKNKALYWVMGGTFVFLLAVLYIPFLRDLFHFSYLHINDLLIGMGASFIGVAWFEAVKVLRVKNHSTGGQ